MMITAAHVFPGPTATFVYDNGTTTATTYSVQVVATLDDLAVWEIAPNQTATFTLTAPIYTGSSELGSTIVDLGRGYQRGAAVTGGWQWGGGQGPLSWGTNTVSAIPTDAQLGTSSSMGGDFLQFDFDDQSASLPGYNPNEAMVTPYDSGGGVFIDVGGQYQLAGVNSLLGARITNGTTDYAYEVTDSSGNQIGASLYNTSGYYYDSYGVDLPITTATPESSFATRISSKQGFIGEADGTISASAAAWNPISNDGLFVVYQNMTTGNISGGGTVELGGSDQKVTLQLAPNSGTSEVSGLSIMSGSTLDVTNNCIIIDGGANTLTEKWLMKCLASGYDGGLWNGPGIDSSMAAASSGVYGVGFADGNDPSVSGLTGGQAEIGYALYGDCNMDGVVNGIDFMTMATNYNQAVTQGWEDGDFTYSGSVNGTDFLLLVQNFDKASSADWKALDAFAAANSISLTDDVPEPSSLTPLLLFSFCAIARWARHRTPTPAIC